MLYGGAIKSAGVIKVIKPTAFHAKIFARKNFGVKAVV